MMYIADIMSEMGGYQMKRIYKFICLTCLYIWSGMVFPLLLICIAKPIVYLSGFEAPCDFQLCCHNLYCHLLKTKIDVVKDAELIDKGFILANHRTLFDGIFDPYMARGTALGRGLAQAASLGHYLLRLFDHRTLTMQRGKDTRQSIFGRFVKHMNSYDSEYTKRIVFYPEGTRQKYKTLRSVDEVKSYLKYGLLKEIYLNKEYPVQLMISSNKELVISEYTMSANFGVNVNVRFSKPIHPRKFATEQDFYDEIAKVWLDCYQTTHAE
jgi:hypothetical protein